MRAGWAAVLALAGTVLCGTRAMSAQTASSTIAVVRPETNAASDPLGIDDWTPRLSWQLASSARSVIQQRFRVLVASQPALLRERRGDVWDSGEIMSSHPWVSYAGAPLASRTRYYWAVRVWTTGGGTSDWSEPAWFETALLSAEEWEAAWIAGPERSLGRLSVEEGVADDEQIRAADELCRPPLWPSRGFFPNAVPNNEGECRALRPAPMLRKSFTITKPVTRARVYTAGLAYNDLTVNGTPASQSVLDPAFTDYGKTVYYATYDVTPLLRRGENVIASVLGSGQYDSSTRTWDWGWDLAEWRATPRLLLQLHIVYEDGTEQTIVSDDTWSVSIDGPTRYDSYYLGETYDARREIPGWNEPGFDEAGWSDVRIVDGPVGELRAQAHESIRVVDVREPGTVTQPTAGVFVYDIGQNLSGWARVRVDAPAGTPIELFYTEKLDSLGRASNETGFALVGGQLQTDYYVTNGSGSEVWTPRFSYKGFRYLQVSAPEAQPLADNVSVSVEAIEQLRTGFEAASTFESSSTLLNRIHANTRWAVESNTFGIITDTPIYEKNAWTGDAQLSSGGIATLFDAERLFTKMARDMVDAQASTGDLPLLAPSNEHYGYAGGPAFKPADCCGATPAWDAFWFVIPWESYRRYGDRRVLETTYPLMQRYLDQWIPQWTGKDGDGYDYTLTSGLGDWDPPEGTPTNIALASTAYYAQFARIAAAVARVLDREDDGERYDRLFDLIRSDFNARFLAGNVYRNEADDAFSHTAQVLPLAFGLVPDSLRSDLAARLAADIMDRRGGNAYVGILGARYILPVLTDAGYGDVAFTVATQTDYPSWGYWIEELGWTALGEFFEATSRSRNHHFFGTPVQWMYERLAGIRPLEPGYEKIEFIPTIPSVLDSVSASVKSVRGTILSQWRKTPSGLEFDVTVPPTAFGLVYIPAAGPEHIAAIQADTVVSADAIEAVRFVGIEADRVVYEVGSGSYSFRVGNR